MAGRGTSKSGNGEAGDPDLEGQKRRETLLGIPAADAAGMIPGRSPGKPTESQRPSGPQPISQRSSLAGVPWLAAEQPSVLLAGTGYPMQEALVAALSRHGLDVETTSVGAAPSAVVTATPSVVVVLGDAARGSGRAVLDALRNAGLDETVPVAVLLEDGSLASRLDASRAGATAAIPRTASVDQIARRISEIAHEKDRDRIRSDFVGDATLTELLEVVERDLTGRVLPAERGPVDPRRVRLLLGSAPEVARLLDEFASGLRREIVRAERTEEDLAHAAETPEDGVSPGPPRPEIDGVRVVLADDDSARADTVADELRRRGATVVVTGLEPQEERMRRLRQADPMVLLMRSEDLAGEGRKLLHAMKEDLRLRWVTLVVAQWSELQGPGEAGRAIEALVGQISQTGDPDRALRGAAESGTPGAGKLERLGPARTLRALSACSRPTRLVVDNPRAQITVDLSEGLVVGAVATEPDDWAPIGEGPAALAALLALSSGSVLVTPVDAPRMLNLMSTVASALDLAERERPPITPSWPPGALPDDPSMPVAGSVGAAQARTATGTPAERPARRGLLVATAAAALVLGAGGALLVSRLAPAPAHASSSAALAPGPRAPHASTAAPAGSVAVQASGPAARGESLTDRARAGEAAAMAELEGRPARDRNVDEDLALALGSVEAQRRAVAELGARCTEHPELLLSPAVAAEWLAHGRSERVAPEALAALAAVPSPRAADLVYALWTGTTERTAGTQMAQDLLSGDALRGRATPALSIALDLRAAETCEEMEALLPRAIEAADRRSLRVLGHLVGVRKCGPRHAEDCYPCLSKSKLVPAAVRAARGRPGPLDALPKR